MNQIIRHSTIILGVLLLLQLGSVRAGVVAQCGQPFCSAGFSVSMNGKPMGGGELIYDAKTGAISLNTQNITGKGRATQGGGIMWITPNGNQIMLNSLGGNADPLLSFGLGATTKSSGATFAFAFDLPIALSGPINTASSVSYSLTSNTSAGAQISGIGGNKVVQSWDVDTSVGGLPDLNKGVDVGDTYFHTGGPATSNSPVYKANSSIIGQLAYDQMAVQVAFKLSPNSSVGISGYVSQTPVPIPAAAWLLISGLGMVAACRRRLSA